MRLGLGFCFARRRARRTAALLGAVCLLSAALLSCGVRRAPHAPDFPADFSATVEVVRGDLCYSAAYTRVRGTETLCVTAPQTLAGLCAAAADGGCTLSVGAVTAALPDAGIFAPFLLFDAPAGCLVGSADQDGCTVYSGRRGADVYRITVDAAGAPVRLSGSVGGTVSEIRVLKFEEVSPKGGGERECS